MEANLGRTITERVENFSKENPWSAVAIFFGLGFGLASSARFSSQIPKILTAVGTVERFLHKEA